MDQDVIQILSRTANKSQYVCKSVRRYRDLVNEVSPADFPTRQLLAALSSRKDVSSQLKAVILAELID